MGPDPMPSDSAPSDTTDSAQRPRTPRPRFWIALGLIVVAIAIVGVGIVVTVSLFTARAELEAAVPLAPKIELAVSHGDEAEAARLAAEFKKHTNAAAGAVGSPFYAIGAVIPGIGPNLQAIRTVAEAADLLAGEVVVPASSFPIHSLKPVDGQLDLVALKQVTPLVHTATASVDRAAARVTAIRTDTLLPPVADAVKKFDAELTGVKTVTDGLNASIDLLPDAFGASGARTYLLVFQNNAELRALGGNPAALLEVRVDNGRFTIAQQASSADFRHQADIPIAPDVAAAYGPTIGSIIQNTTMVPDFPTVAGYQQKFWADRYGTKVDGVVSFDPIALSNLLTATGAVQLSTGDTLNSGNAVKLLLSTVYDRYRVPADQDEFFAKVAAAMFQAVVSGKGEFSALATQLADSVQAGRLLIWSDRNNEEEVIGAGEVAGELPSDNTSTTTVGAWINDFTFAKMGYFLDAKITATSSCAAGPYSISESLTNSAPAGVGVLPPYVTGPIYPDGVIHTDVVFTGPVGSKLGDIKVGGVTVTPSGGGMLNGRPVVRASVTVAPGATTRVSATFSSVAGASKTLVVRSTPMVRDTPVTITPCS